jgi:hypothetical protein
MRAPFLITGCPRSGTMYTARVFEEAGYAVSHEKVGLDGCVSWYHGSPFAYSKEGYEPEFRTVALQVRHPIQAISSMRVLSLYTLAHVINPTLGITKDDWPENETLLRVFFWLRWHEWIEETFEPAITFQVEQLSTRWLRLCAVLGLEPPPLMPELEPNVNAMPHGMTGWEEIRVLSPELHAELQDAAARYGYNGAA